MIAQIIVSPNYEKARFPKTIYLGGSPSQYVEDNWRDRLVNGGLQHTATTIYVPKPTWQVLHRQTAEEQYTDIEWQHKRCKSASTVVLWFEDDFCKDLAMFELGAILQRQECVSESHEVDAVKQKLVVGFPMTYQYGQEVIVRAACFGNNGVICYSIEEMTQYLLQEP